ncbi:MAG: ABC transporter substrate-binding protein [Gammaproteobacteria bacterium]
MKTDNAGAYGRVRNRFGGCLLAAAAALGSAGQALGADVLRMAMSDDPPHLDVHVTTAGLTSIVGLHILETLYTFDASFEPVPLLVESETVGDDGKTIVMKLRQGVLFHNGDSMEAGDVVASLDRWGAHGGRGKVLYDHVDSVEATGAHEVTIKFKQVYGPWKSLLAFLNGGPVIYPAEIASQAKAEPLANEQIVGTGPFKFNEWRPNRHIEVVRFDDYAQPPGNPDGYAGRREVKVDALRFIAVPDMGTRVSGVQAGDYDYAERISGDLFDELNADPGVKVVRQDVPTMPLIFFNSTDGIFKDNYALRRAIMAAFDHAEALRIAVGPEALWKAQGAVYPPGTYWHTEAGLDAFPSQGDPAKARQLAADAGYDGAPIRFMVATSYPLHYDTGQVFERQLKAAGFNIDFQVSDWPTLLGRRSDPKLWDMFETTHGVVPDPILYTFMNDNYPGWWVSPEKEALEAELTGTVDANQRKQVWSKIQALMYEQVPVVKPGDVYIFDVASPRLAGLPDTVELNWPRFWGVSK